MQEIKLKWLIKPQVGNIGTTFCIPWKKAQLWSIENVIVRSKDGSIIPTQNWPLSYWGDGSIKVSGHAAFFGTNLPDEVFVCIEETAAAKFETMVEVYEDKEYIYITTGKLECKINKNGNKIIEYLKVGQKIICSNFTQILTTEKTSNFTGYRTKVEEEYIPQILGAKVDSHGPLRCVIKVWGRHLRNTRMTFDGSLLQQGWLPFELRLYFYANADKIKLVHTFIYNGNPHQDFIKGLGLKFSLPLHSPLYNRFVRFGGDSGLFCESPKNLIDVDRKERYKTMFQNQVNGQPVDFDIDEDHHYIREINNTPEWDEFVLFQDSSEHYVIKKRTSCQCSFIKATEGRRSMGFAYVGDENGGLAVSLKDFWQKYPSGFEIKDLTSPEASLIVWLWPPYGEVMDLRHYDFGTYTSSSYEGFDEYRSTPYGIANTNELWLYCFDYPPTSEQLLEYAKMQGFSPLLVCGPERYKETKVFEGLNLPDNSNPKKEKIERILTAIVDFYLNEVERRKWYGFWVYGDFMHSYDIVRHMWKYDIGGYAWQNTELVPNIWLWLMFLRTGRFDIFKMAEAMTRHTSEVDVYHLGEYKGLGSRHNVVHWGCGCKEVRISMAYLHRYYYYLTADERIGQLMDDVKDVDKQIMHMDPMRAYFTIDPENRVHIRVGPDVMTFCANWFVRWERCQEEIYKQKIIKILDFLKKNPAAFISGGVFDYDPEKTQLKPIEYTGGSNFVFCFGNTLVWFEIAKNFEDKELEELCAQQGLFYTEFKENKDEILKSWGVPSFGFKLNMLNIGMAAFAAMKKNIPELKREIWQMFLDYNKNPWLKFICDGGINLQLATVPAPVVEVPFISTNIASQWSINAMLALEFIGDEM
ncbi:exo-rhamnogalacturonan lyase family protein [Anaerocellum danielii]|uniref:Uncharacterized protein n=1 Tax=Anaerocellum danielii TaxID=1387557 RepID=A0ABZ0TYJ9_9FIRM|nr:hypothetical protein [Caldicellulosiruptor danielii]WPX08329.1 hypothetical protein SOJ16_002204 [Caldicellulosiruptor danielii]